MLWTQHVINLLLSAGLVLSWIDRRNLAARIAKLEKVNH